MQSTKITPPKHKNKKCSHRQVHKRWGTDDKLPSPPLDLRPIVFQPFVLLLLSKVVRRNVLRLIALLHCQSIMKYSLNWAAGVKQSSYCTSYSLTHSLCVYLTIQQLFWYKASACHHIFNVVPFIMNCCVCASCHVATIRLCLMTHCKSRASQWQ